MDLIEKLIEGGILDKEKASSIEKKAGETNKTKEEIILSEKIISEEELFSLKSQTIEVPLKEEINTENISEEVLRIIPEDTASHYKMVALDKDDGEVEIGMVYPENLKAQEALKFILRREGSTYKIHLISLSDFREIFSLYGAPVEKIKSDLLEKLVEEEVFGKNDALGVQEEAEQKNKTVEEVLLEKNTITEEELFNFKSEVFDFPLKKGIDPENISREDFKLLHEDSINHYKMIPIGKTEDWIEIGMIYPENLKAQEALKFISRQNIFSYKIHLISFTEFKKIKEKYRGADKDTDVVLLEKLVERNLLGEDQLLFLEKEAEQRNKAKEEILLEKKMVPEEEIFNLKSEITGIPLKKEINPDEIEEDLLRLFPEDAIDYYKMIPIGKEEEKVMIGMVYPEDPRAKEAVKLIFEKENLPYQIFLISLTDFKKINKGIKVFTKELGSTLSEKLVSEGFLDKEKAREIEVQAEEGDKTKEEIFLENNIISEEDLFRMKAEVTGVHFRSDIDTGAMSEDLLRIIPEDSANYYKMAPIEKTDEEIEIGMVYPENLRAKEALRFLSRRDSFSYKVSLISFTTFDDILKQYRTLTKEVGEALEDVDMGEESTEQISLDVDKDVGKLAEEAPIVKVVGVILKNATEGGASDIHIEPSRQKMKVRFRVDGILYSSLYLPMAIHLATVARIKILAGLKIDEQRIPQDGRFSTKKGGQNIDFRVSTFPTTLGEKVVIRVLDPTKGILSLDDLGIMGRNFQIVSQSVKKPTGMMLATGPTGSGKSTTLYAVLGILNKEGVNIVTLEDPVEYFVDGVNQSQINPEIGYVFAKGLRQILRQDPDIIMVGEIRDDETAELAIHAALTGHMVLSTLHTNSAIGAIPRLIDMGIKPFLIPPAVNALMSQRLVRRLCDKCKKQIIPTEEIKALVMNEIKDIPEVVLKDIDIPSPLKIYAAQGCKYCSEEGMTGRISINEILKMTQELGEITMKNPTEKELLEEAKEQGMINLKQDGILKVIQGYTTIEEVLRATEEK